MSEENEKSLRNRTIFNGRLTVAELLIAVTVIFGSGVSVTMYKVALADGKEERKTLKDTHGKDMTALHTQLEKMETQFKEDRKEVKDDIKQINQNIFKILRAVK